MKFIEVESRGYGLEEIAALRLWKFPMEVASAKFKDSSAQDERWRGDHFPLAVCKEPSIAVDAMTRRVGVEQGLTTAREAPRAKLSMVVANHPSEKRRELTIATLHEGIPLGERRER
jgi:hypothetical protein